MESSVCLWVFSFPEHLAMEFNCLYNIISVKTHIHTKDGIYSKSTAVLENHIWVFAGREVMQRLI